MLISTQDSPRSTIPAKSMFQSLDWVDVDFDLEIVPGPAELAVSFNPSTGLMLISTRQGALRPGWQSGVSIPRLG